MPPKPSLSVDHSLTRSRTTVEPLANRQVRRLERLFEKSSMLKHESWNTNHKNAYVSDIVNVQSLLNIRSLNLQRTQEKSNSSAEDRIVINVCGDRYETHRTTLELYPDTLLGNRKRRQHYYDKNRGEYFFDRNRSSFEAILYYYQSHGHLRRPAYVSLDLFLEEVAFFQLGQEALNQIRKDENIEEVRKVRLPKSRWRRYLWATMEYPDYSRIAKIVNVISLLMIMLSTIALAVESLPMYTDQDDLNCQIEQNLSINLYQNYSSNDTAGQSPDAIYVCHTYFTSSFFVIQTICVAFFTMELLVRAISMPSILDFVKNFMNWIDLLTVVPFFVTLGIRVSGRQNVINTSTYVGLRLLRILRFVRVFKFYRVFKNIKSLRVLISTMKQSLPDFAIMTTILSLLGFLFGAAAYFAENDTNGAAFDSIPKATYWGVITICSVGYGDIIPITPIGRIVACLCALCGSATIGMLVSVLVGRYQSVYARKLFINEEQIDFNDFSDDDDTESKVSMQSSRGRDRRPKVSHDNPAFEPPSPAPARIDEPVLISTAKSTPSNEKRTNDLHFIIGYVDDERKETSRDLLDKISNLVAVRNLTGNRVLLNVIANEQDEEEEADQGVRFDIASLTDEEHDDLEQFTEISKGRSDKNSVLMTFQRRPTVASQVLVSQETLL